MRKRFGQKVIHLLLSVFVLTWGTFSPAVQHVHAGGNDLTHRHDDGRSHDAPHGLLHKHGALHHHGPDGDHREHATSDKCGALGDLFVHQHWKWVVHQHRKWLGIDFVITLPQEPSDGGDKGDTVPPSIVLVKTQEAPITQPRRSNDYLLLVAACSLSPDVVCELPLPVKSLHFSTSIPLCDSARLERSGVLLA